jgi:polyketide synthase 7
LPATLVFDHPTPAAIAAYLRDELVADDVREPALLAELDRIGAELARTSPADGTGPAVTRRLRSLLWEWTDRAGDSDGADGGEDPGDDLGDDRESVSDSDLFSALDRLGAVSRDD